MKMCVFDLEGDGLNPTKIHCLVAAIYSNHEWVKKSTTNYDEMRSFFAGCDVVIGHNIYRWDIPVVERLLDIKVKAKVVDTLALSWYLYPDRLKHGLEHWGKDFGILKPEIDDWEGLTSEEYIHRCSEDVVINSALWDKIWKDLTNLYGDDDSEVWRFIDYLMFKMDCAAEAERSRWKLDVDRCLSSLEKLEAIKEEKVEELRKAMPTVQKTAFMYKPAKIYKEPKSYKRPANMVKANGTLSVAGAKYQQLCDSIGVSSNLKGILVPSRELSSQGLAWIAMLESLGLPETHEAPIEYIKSETEPNPNSVTQIKDWLYTLGWIPQSFKYVGDRAIEQLRIDRGDEKILCPSIVKLFPKEPALEALQGLTVLTHRIGVLNGYLSNVDEEGYVQAQVQGLTNTLRFKHKVVVNLPSIKKPYGDIVRGVLIAPEGYELCGSDMASLEDRTKQHYMWEFDPEYVKEMQTPDFDPHLALAEFAGALTAEQVQSHKNYSYYKNLYKNAVEAGEEENAKKFKALYEAETDYSSIRHLYKTANYSCTYGAGGAKLGLALDIPTSEGKEIVQAYRTKNWAINAIADATLTKPCLGGTWLYNPVSGFWYSLRHDKDKFSTLNQGTGVFCFDTWICNFRKRRPQLTAQMHDEVVLCVKKGYREECEKLLVDAIDETNAQLNLNRELGISVQFGENYAEIH